MSGNRTVLDTNIILYLLAGDETVSRFLQGKECYLSIITELELIGYPEITVKELKLIKDFLGNCTIVDLNDGIKTIYSSLRRDYKLKLGDATAAATAIYLDLPFMSADKVFTRVTELQLTSYTP